MFLLLLPLLDNRPGELAGLYDHARKLFQYGSLTESQREAALGFEEFRFSNPEWAAKFQLLDAEAMDWSGRYDESLRLLDSYPDSTGSEGAIKKLALEGAILSHQHDFAAASARLAQAQIFCRQNIQATCGEVLQSQGILAVQEGKIDAALPFFHDALAFARSHNDRFLEANVSLSLSWAALQVDHFDEAMDWSRIAYRDALALDAEDLAQGAAANLGWAYYQLGDAERALELFLDSEKHAVNLGDIDDELKWTTAAGYVYRDKGDLTRATQAYRHALSLAGELDSKEGTENALEDLAQVSVEAGKLDEAGAYIDKVTPMELMGGNRLSANVMLTQGMLAAARRQDKQAESSFLAVQNDPKSPTTTRLDAGEQLARLFESEGNAKNAEQIYKATLNDFDSAQAELKSEESKLPFVANAESIYDDYIHLLLAQGRIDDALAVADRSRARTLARSLAAPGSGPATHLAVLNPRQVAQKAGATLLFYWLGPKQSCLWAITPQAISFFPLPPQDQIVSRIDRYSKAVLDSEDPLENANDDGQALYRMLIAPASNIIRPNAPVMILADGALSRLNFETLLAPGPGPGGDANSEHPPDLHYWIDDATLISAPSLAMIASARPAKTGPRNLLLLGDPVSPSDDFPSLPLFSYEMKAIQKHFDPHNVAAFSSAQATPAAYLKSNPAQYSYIHFVSHAVSSRTDPLDSAIILSGSDSGPNAGADSYKLYARDIMRRPIDARLVTISACNASGTRSYAGEGLVGLSWAFLRAGARSVIGSLWEVSDDSSPRLMNTLYQGLEDGQAPASALRKAKLSLLHSNGRFQSPFYWAPFQIYSSQ